MHSEALARKVEPMSVNVWLLYPRYWLSPFKAGSASQLILPVASPVSRILRLGLLYDERTAAFFNAQPPL